MVVYEEIQYLKLDRRWQSTQLGHNNPHNMYESYE